ncbi:nuclear transport factor 2 family protein [Paraburkholderia sp. J7]|uniref:nuclear transport factor 2 family protein n=1 Tax=Paraburkholderia sp. J7 TaxID=2805438 RepID=UPI002AB6815A|nr:nuclear transport factor 2 family protein [Paraburkholderia sp. J7]
MSSKVSRQQLLDLLDAFCDVWAGAPSATDAPLFTEDIELFSSHSGNAQGRVQVLSMLRSDFIGSRTVRISSTNRVPRGNDNESMIGGYILGELEPSQESTDNRAATFGGVITLSLEGGAEQLRIRSIRFQLNFAQGNLSLLNGWTLPAMDRAWKPGDPPAVIVSELDSPWHRIPASELPTTDEEAIIEAWYRYAWALDQADFVLFDKSFSDNVEAELTPMGRMKGRRTLLATLKAFRLPWPWMKHYGEPIRVDLGIDGRSAALVVARIIPGQTHAPDGKRIYGAHYRINAIQEDGNFWRIGQMEYIPGWISVE